MSTPCLHKQRRLLRTGGLLLTAFLALLLGWPGPVSAQSQPTDDLPPLEDPEDAPPLDEIQQRDRDDLETAEGRPLADEKWQDREYGLAVKLPIGVRTVSRTGDDYQLRIADEDGMFTMGIVVKQSRRVLDMPEVLYEAKRQVLGVHSSTELLDEYIIDVDGAKMAVVLFRMPDTDQDDAFAAQGLVQLDPRTIAIVEVNSAWSDADEVRGTFEAMLQTLELRGLEDLEEQRARQLRRTNQWRQQLRVSDLHAALIDEQLFRIVQDDRDIGYMRMRQRQSEQQGMAGIEVEVQSRVIVENHHVDSLATFFSSDDDSAEFWEIRTTQRPRGGEGEERTFTETGIRTGADIVVTQDEPLGSDRIELKQPAVGYLPLAETWLLSQLLPNDQPATYGYYSYNTNEATLTYRTDEVAPTLDGFSITTRLRPNAPELQASYDANRRLREKQFTPHRKLVPATASEIERRWLNR